MGMEVTPKNGYNYGDFQTLNHHKIGYIRPLCRHWNSLELHFPGEDGLPCLAGSNNCTLFSSLFWTDYPNLRVEHDKLQIIFHILGISSIKYIGDMFLRVFHMQLWYLDIAGQSKLYRTYMGWLVVWNILSIYFPY